MRIAYEKVLQVVLHTEEGQDLAVLNEMSGDHSGSDQGTNTTDGHSFHIPAYLGYLSLGFKVISTVIIVLMAGWVIITIRTTRSLYKTHNILVAYLMVIDAMFVFIHALLSGAMTIGYFTGENFVGCNVYMFMLYPTGIIVLTFLVMSADKVIAVTFPFKHREIMKPRVVCGILVTKHILTVMIYSKRLFAPSSRFTKIAQFGTCTTNDPALLENLITVTIPIFLCCLITVILDIYLTIKAYQIRKQIEEESKLSGGHAGDNDRLKALKKKDADIKKHLKPMITLMVVVMGNSFFGLMVPMLIVSAVLLDSPVVYESIVRYLILPNIGFIIALLHPFVYALYFKQVREPMMRLLKRITCPCKCKSADVAPEPQRRRINWLNPN